MVLVTGRARGELADAILDYEQRAARYWPIEVVEVRQEQSRSMDRRLVQQKESARLLENVPGGALIVACDERGRPFTSTDFSAFLTEQRERARDVAFLIGGAFGLDEVIRGRADVLLAVAPWTLAHDLARLVLAEQLYRAGTIARGEPYHK